MEILAIITAGARALNAATALASKVNDVTSIATDLLATYDAVSNVFSKEPRDVSQDEIDDLDAISDDLDAQAAAIVVEPPPLAGRG